MPVSKFSRGRFSRRSHEVDVLAVFLLLQAAAGLLLLPRPSHQLSSTWSTTRNQHERSLHQRGSPSHFTTGCWYTSPIWFAKCGHDGRVHTDLDSDPLFCCAGSASPTPPLRSSKRLPLNRGAAISKRKTIVDRLPTALQASDHETSVTTDAATTTAIDAATTTATDAAVESEEHAASPGTDGVSNIARGNSIGVSDDNSSQHEAVNKRGGTWGARLRSSLRRKSRGVTESTSSDEIMEAKGHKGLFTYDWENGPRVKWVASKNGKAIVEEGPRKLCDYLALPPTEYSVLDPKMITRLTDDTFKMNCDTLNFFGTKVKPVVFMRVDVRQEESQANIVVERVELDGSEAVRAAGGTFNVTSTTVVASAEVDDGNPNTKELQTRADIEIELLVPNENFVPLGLLSRTGSFVMQRVVDIGLPQFTKFLKKDYAKWSNGDDSRSAVASENESLLESKCDS